VDTDSSINTMSVIMSGRDIDLEATLDYEGRQHTSSGTRIKR